MTNYCLGFMFSRAEDDVLLIQKQHPDWQKGLFNGIGGKLLDDEPAIVGMVREFKEETELITQPADWIYVTTMLGQDWRVDVFTSFNDCIYNFKRPEEEQPRIIAVSDLQNFPIILNLKWLIPMCLNENEIDYKVTRYVNYASAGMLLDDEFSAIRSWAKNKGIFDKGDIKTQTIKLLEEAGELAAALLRDDKEIVSDSIGDIAVVLTSLAHFNGTTIERCINDAYQVIAGREGKMVNGNFLKNM